MSHHTPLLDSQPAADSARHAGSSTSRRVRRLAPLAALIAVTVGITGVAYLAQGDPAPTAEPAYDEFADPDAPQVTTPPLPAAGVSAGTTNIALADGATDATIARLEAELSPNSSPGTLSLLARLLLQKAAVTGDAGTYARAVTVLDRAVAAAPNNLDVRAQRAGARATVHDFSGAARDASRVLSTDPSNPAALAVSYDAAYETGRYDLAKQRLDQLVAAIPTAPQVLIRQARWAALNGDPLTAASFAARARTAADSDGVVGTARASYDLIAGKLAMDEGRYDLALGAYQSALTAAPGWHSALLGFGRALAATGDLVGAEAALAQASNAVPLPDTLTALGDVRAALGDPQGAALAYDTVDVVAQLEGAQRLTSRAVVLSRADRGIASAAAVRDARAELKTRKDVYGFDALGWALLAAGKSEAAAVFADRSLALGTQDPLLFAHAGLVHAAAGNTAQASDLLERASAVNASLDPVLQDRVAAALTEIRTGAQR